jgi:hypothetical protein
MRIRRTVCSVAVILALLEGAAAAQRVTAREIVRGTVNRARRAVAFGPSVGALPLLATAGADDTGFDVALTFGLGLYLFAIPVVPSVELIQDVVRARVEAKLRERLQAALARGEKPTEEELAAWGREIYQGVKAEVLGRMNARARTVERPRLALDLEGQYLLGAGYWETRLTLGLGVKRLTIGPTAALRLWDATGFALGGEVACRLLPGRRPRSPVIDLFLRMDFEVADRAARGDEAALGLRLLLDLV